MSETEAATLVTAVEPATPERKLKTMTWAMLRGKAQPMLKMAKRRQEPAYTHRRPAISLHVNAKRGQ